jgi:hypothetical protein
VGWHQVKRGSLPFSRALRRCFVRLQQILASTRQLAARVEELERQLAAHDKTLQGHHGNINTS